MNDHKVRILRAFAEFVLLAAITLTPALTVYMDVEIIGNKLRDKSRTEYAQEVLLAISALMLWYGAWKEPQSRGFLVLVAGFFTCMFIREHDELLNRIFQGFWFYPAMVTAAVSAGMAVAYRKTVLRPMAAFIGTKSYHYMFFGLLVVLVFSRVFGSGKFLWEPIMGDAYQHMYKSAIQEGLELFGYIFVFYGSSILLRHVAVLRGGGV